MHQCSAHGGVDIPLQQANRYGLIGPAHSIALVDRGDYVGRERVQHGGTMAVHARRPDGSHDTTVFAPTAAGRLIVE